MYTLDFTAHKFKDEYGIIGLVIISLIKVRPSLDESILYLLYCTQMFFKI